ncbi:basic leucine zipper 34-like [Tripterygium wilfordii]|nr:basic leucine zipper 34-like [Tripterygium wilfordii]
MAQLPPKIPNWPDFSHQRVASMGALPHDNATTTTTQNPSWVDEFLDFSTTRRGTHQRSISDSIAFLEAPMVDECRSGGGGAPHPPGNSDHNHHHHEFDKFDDEQFMSMFNDDDLSNAVAATASSNPSSSSDRNSINDEKEPTPSDQKHQIRVAESDEMQSQDESETLGFGNNSISAPETSSNDRIIDPKRVKRILANRQSAQRSRVRKLQYVSVLERSVTSLQSEVSVLSPRVAFLDHQRLLLNVDNSSLKQRIVALAQDKIFKDAHQEALKREIERLRQVYNEQNLKKMETGAPISSSPATESKPHNTDQKDQQQLLQVIRLQSDECIFSEVD